MTANAPFQILLVDDDIENLQLLAESLPNRIEGHAIEWISSNDFADALALIERRRFDIVVSDVYRDSADGEKTVAAGDARVFAIVDEVRGRRFCPIVLFTDGVFPEIVEGPFLHLVDKSTGNADLEQAVGQILNSGIPAIAQQLHDELDRANGSYLWEFLDERWTSLQDSGFTAPEVMERLIRRRAATQLARLDQGGKGELHVVEGVEFYIHPKLVNEYRLGEIVRKGTEYRAILTPHCHLTVQNNAEVPRADFVLTVEAVPAKELLEKHPIKGSTAVKRRSGLGRALQSPAALGSPDGRYWFLPGFLDMPHLFLDFLQVHSVPLSQLNENWSPVAVLDVPFAEAMQACFVRFYSSVGLPSLDPARFVADLLDEDDDSG